LSVNAWDAKICVRGRLVWTVSNDQGANRLKLICRQKVALLAFYEFENVRDREEGWGKTNID